MPTIIITDTYKYNHIIITIDNQHWYIQTWSSIDEEQVVTGTLFIRSPEMILEYSHSDTSTDMWWADDDDMVVVEMMIRIDDHDDKDGGDDDDDDHYCAAIDYVCLKVIHVVVTWW